MLRSTRAIVFDLDGTLVDSLPDIMTHLNGALVDHGLPSYNREEIGHWVGYGAEQLVIRAVPQQDLVAPVLATFRARYRSRPVIATRVFDGLGEVLDGLAPRFSLAVLSNKPHDLTAHVCTALLGRWPFKVVAGARPDRPHKPDPQALRDVVADLGVTVETTVLVGDSEVDVATAHAAGATSIAVAWGLRPVAVLEAANPTHLLHAPHELAALFA
ncbi:MAG TPA: HAD family hydrolase [Kofleriaceae bacterium]|nr:HAD family hydrolase [Kofleriaceae bacterium]